MGFTRFPNLNSVETGTACIEEVVEEVLSEGDQKDANNDLIFFAWASVLKSYTGNEILTFYGDDDVVSIDSNQWSITQKSTIDGGLPVEDGSGTGVFSVALRQGRRIPDLALRVVNKAGSQVFTLISRNFIPKRHLKDVMDHFVVSLRWMKRDGVSDVPLSKLSHLESSATNTTSKSCVGPSLLHELVSCKTKKTAIEFCNGNGSLDCLAYEQLQRLSSALARRLKQSLPNIDTSSQPIFAILIPQSLELYISQLAVLKAGCAFCSIALDTPEERLLFILKDINAPMILTVSSISRNEIHGHATLDVCLSALEDGHQVFDPIFDVKPSDPAYVMFTSGSTGAPKGVPVSHRAVTQSLLAHAHYIPKYVRMLQFAAPTFDVSLFEIFFTFFKEATLVACDRSTMLDDLASVINRLDVDAAELTPTVAGSLLKHRHAVPKLKLLLTIGEMLTRPIIDEFGGNDNQESMLWAMYGPTEAAIHCTVMPAFKSQTRAGNIGFPLETVSAYIASPTTGSGPRIEILPVGFVGELVIGGPQLANGYMNRPEQTGRAFIDDMHEGRLYRTGDKARKLPDGSFECLGRIVSGQVKLRGQRIELGEIEQTALRVPECRAAVASILLNNIILFCYADMTVAISDITALLKKWLPAHMVPKEVKVLSTLPHLASGKIDKKALEEEYLASHLNVDGLEPSFPDQKMSRLLDSLQEFVKQDVTPMSSLANLGIDSLSAIELASQLKTCGIHVSTIDVLKSDTVQQLSEHWKQEPLATQEMISAPSDKDLWKKLQSHADLIGNWSEIEAIRPCTPSQVGMLAETARDDRSYWNNIELSLPSSATEQCIVEAIQTIVNSNDILRSGFVHSSHSTQQFLQIVWADIHSDCVKVIKHQDLAALELPKNLLHPASFVLWRNPDGLTLSISIHHAVYDGWSMDLIVSDLERILFEHEYLTTRPSFELVQQYYSSVDNTKSTEYWENQLRQCSSTIIDPLKVKDEVKRVHSSISMRFSQSMEVIRINAKELKVSPQCFYQAVFTCVVAQLAQTSDVIIATVTSGRTIPVANVEAVIGPCMSTLPLRVNLAHSRTSVDLVRNIQSVNRQMVNNTGPSMREIKRTIGCKPGSSLSDALFIWQETLEGRTKHDDSSIKIISNSDHVEFKVTLEVEPRRNDVYGKLSYSSSILTDGQARALLMSINQIASSCFGELEISLLDLAIPSVREPSQEWKSIISCSKRSIPLDPVSQEVHDTPGSAALTPTETEIRISVSELMSIPKDNISPTMPLSFFGIDSLYAIALSKLLRTNGYSTCSVGAILESRSIRDLAEKLDSLTGEPLLATVKDLPHFLSSDERALIEALFDHEKTVSKKVFPCTPLQEAMLAASDLSEGAYCNVMTFKVIGDRNRLEQSLIAIFAKHAIFRTSFVQTENKEFPFVQVLFSGPLPNYHMHHGSKPDEAINQLIKDHLPPYQYKFRTDSSGTWLDFKCHHAIFDATAMAQVLSEVELYYRDECSPDSVSVEPFLALGLSQRSEESLRYWSDHLHDYAPKLIRHIRSQKHQTLVLPLETSRKQLNDAVIDLSASLLILCQAALSKTLSCLLRIEDVCFGSVASGRTYALDGIERLVFPTFNTIPVRVDLTRAQSNSSLLRSLQKSNIDSLSHQLVPLRAIQSRQGFLETGLFDALLLVQHECSKLDPNIWERSNDIGNMAFPLIFELTPELDSNIISLSFHYEEALLSSTEASHISRLFDFHLSNCIRYPNASALDFALDKAIPALDFSSRLYSPASASASASTMIPNDSPRRQLSSVEDRLLRIITDFTRHTQRSLTSTDSIHHLGIDSIGTIQLASIIRRLMHTSTTSADILERPCISELARFIEKKADCANAPPAIFDLAKFRTQVVPEVQKNLDAYSNNYGLTIDSIRPCTPLQEGLISQLLKNPGSYVNSMTLDLPSFQNSASLKEVLEGWISRHEILRSGFLPVHHSDHSFVMVTYDSIPEPLMTWVSEDSSSTSRDVFHQRAARSISQDICRPPWRALFVCQEEATRLQLVMFHALFDAHSLRLLLDDLANLLTDTIIPKQLSLKSYDSLVIAILSASRLFNEGNTVNHHASFWKDHLSGSHITRFPNMSPCRGPTATRVVQIRSQRTLSSLKTLLNKSGITLQAAAQAAWAQILAAYTGEQAVIFGVVLSGRDIMSDANEVAFPCITTVPCAAKEVKNPMLLSHKMMDFNSKIRHHQFCRNKDITTWSALPNKALFDTILAVQNLSVTDSATGHTWRYIDESASDEYALSIEIEMSYSDEMLIRATFDEAKLPLQQAQLMLAQLDSLIHRIAEQKTDWSCMSTDLLSISPPRDLAIEAPVSLLHQFVESSASMFTDHVALEFVHSLSDLPGARSDSTKWTYGQVNAESNKIAALLQSRDIQPQSLVAICFDKCPEASFAIIGILKIGCAYVALDPKAPAARKKYMIRDSGATIILSMANLSSNFDFLQEDDKVSAEVLCLDRVRLPPESFRPVTISNSDLCYCLYTSGTTGKPKGCEITHENAVQAMMAFSRLFRGRWDHKSKWLQFASFHFDVSVLEQFWSWSVGISVVSASRDLMLEDLPGFIRALSITHLDLTPSLATLLHPEDVPSLCKGVFITGGEALRQDILDVWGPMEVIHNGYGPTETTIGCTMFPRVPQNGRPSNIGRQFDNVGSYVLEPGTEIPVLKGGVGELCISGKLVGKGYLNNETLTKAKFPTLAAYDERVYRTGDLVRSNHDGTFQFLGRADDQIKLRGQRLEIGEVDSVIRSSGAVQALATFVFRHPKQKREHLVSFAVFKSSKKSHNCAMDIDISVLPRVHLVLEYCRAHLQPYMVPTYLVPITILPLTANNKVDHAGLQQFYESMSPENMKSIAMSSSGAREQLAPAELRIAKVLREAFNVSEDLIHANSNIFELGLDSITTIKFTRLLKAAGFSNASLLTVTQAPTISALSRSLSGNHDSQANEQIVLSIRQKIKAISQRHKTDVARRLGIESDQIQSLHPCLPLQEGMVSSALSNKPAEYFLTFRFLLRKAADTERLRAAWHEAHRRLDILRTSFVQTDSGLLQVVLRNVSLPWVEVAAERCADQNRIDSQSRIDWIKSNSNQVVRPLLLLLRKGEHTILELNIFHGLYDGASLPLLLKCVRQIYHGEVADFGPQFHDCLPYGPLKPYSGHDFWTQNVTGHTTRIPGHSNMMSSPEDVVQASLSFKDIGRLESARRAMNIRNQDQDQDQYDQNEVWSLDHVPSSALYPLTLEAELTKSSLDLSIISSRQHFDQDILAHLLSRFELCLSAALNDCRALITELVKITTSSNTVITTNGIHNDDHDINGYGWSGNSSVLRQEIAKLAGVVENEVKPEQSIFELGLDSIDAVILSSKLSGLNISLPVSTIMRYPSIRELCDRTAKSELIGNSSQKSHLWEDVLTGFVADSGLAKSQFSRILPATPLQEAMVSRMVTSDFREYYNHDVLEIQPWVDMKRLRNAWNSVIEECEIFRTAFAVVENTKLEVSYAQVVYHLHEHRAWRSADLSKYQISDVLDNITAAANEKGITEPLLRLTAVSQESNRMVVLSLPHALYDGWSIQLLHQDVKAHYYGKATKRPANDMILQDVLTSSSENVAIFWQGYLSGCSPCLFTAIEPNKQTAVYRHEVTSAVPMQNLRQFCKQEGITLHCLTQMCWSLVLSSSTRSLDVLFGVVLSGRDTEESRNAQFPTMNTVLFRSVTHGSYSNMLQYIQDGLSSIREYQHCSLRQVQSLAGSTGQKLFNSLFLFQGQIEHANSSLPDLYKSIGGSSEVEYPVCVEAEASDNTLVWRTACQSSFLTSEGVKMLLDQLEETLKVAIRDPNRDIVNLSHNRLQISHLPSFLLEEPVQPDDAKFSRTTGVRSSAELSATEKLIRQALAEVSSTAEELITLNSSIFHHGLDSISAIKLCTTLKRMGIRLKLSDLLNDPTVFGIAQHVDRSIHERPEFDEIEEASQIIQQDLVIDRVAKLLRVRAEVIKEIKPATSGQTYFLNTWNMSRGGLFYSGFEYHVYGPVSKSQIETAWKDIVEANPILRTIFVCAESAQGEFLQVVLETVQTGITSARICVQPWHHLVVSGVRENVWKINLRIHHALYDGVSLDTIVGQLQTRINDRNMVLPSQSLVSLYHRSSQLSESRKFWSDYLSGMHKNDEEPRLDVSAPGQRVELYNPALIPDISRLTQAARTLGISSSALLLAAYGTWLSDHLTDGQSEIVIGIYLANRYEESASEHWSTMPTVNIVPLKLTIGHSKEVAQIACQIQKDLNQIRRFPNSAVSLSNIRAWTGVTVDCIVNIVNIPDAGAQKATDQVQIREHRAEYNKTEGQVVAFGSETFELPREMAALRSDRTYRPSFDVEMAVRNNALDVGLFAPTSRLSLEQAQTQLANFRKILGQIV